MSFELIPAAKISSSGLEAERIRMELTANNLANVNSTDKNGNVYRKHMAIFEASYNDDARGGSTAELEGVKVSEIATDKRKPLEVYAPYHPYADDKGMLAMPNISPIEEMMDMITATRAYEANLSALKQSREIADKTIALSRGGN